MRLPGVLELADPLLLRFAGGTGGMWLDMVNKPRLRSWYNARGVAVLWVLIEIPRLSAATYNPLELKIAHLSSYFANIGDFFTERSCQINLVILLVYEYLANLFGHGKFAKSLTLSNPRSIISNGLILVF